MALFYKSLEEQEQGMYLFFPGEENRTPWKRSCVILFLEDVSETRIHALLRGGLEDFCIKNQVILAIPVPDSHGWGIPNDSELEKAIHHFSLVQGAVDRPDSDALPVNSQGIPTMEAMLRTWHPMNDVRYVAGEGTGADRALALAASAPSQIAALLAVDGDIPRAALKNAVLSPVPAILSCCSKEAERYLKEANHARKAVQDNLSCMENAANPLQRVYCLTEEKRISADLLERAWDELFSRVHRPNTGRCGDCEPREKLGEDFDFYVNDCRLDGTPHTWFVHCSSRISGPAPLLLFLHGGSDNPEEAAVMSRFHRLGEQEGFLTVYPWATNRCFWNQELAPDGSDDLHFLTCLLEDMQKRYPVDPERIYVSGFSNGAAMAQTLALLCPEKIAALCHIDSNWPGLRSGAVPLDWREIRPFALGMEKKKEYDYRMPVWYTYGSREPSYPVVPLCSQQHQYDFWKRYNHIAVLPTRHPGEEEYSACGVAGEQVEWVSPSQKHPEHWYEVNRFFSQDEIPLNLYNYVLMHDKGHDVAEMDPVLAWEYVRRFRRKADGSLQVE